MTAAADGGTAPRSGVLLDRDGTIIVDHGYVGSVDRVQFIDGAAQAIASFNRAGVPAAVVTNQAGVARGMYGIEDVGRVHDYIAARLAEYGAHIDLFIYCPYHPAGVVQAFARTSEDRKPAPGMAKAAAAALNLDLTSSWVVGDRPEDVGLARAVGASAVYLGGDGLDGDGLGRDGLGGASLGSAGLDGEGRPRPGTWSFPSLAAAAPFILNRIAG